MNALRRTVPRVAIALTIGVLATLLSLVGVARMARERPEAPVREPAAALVIEVVAPPTPESPPELALPQPSPQALAPQPSPLPQPALEPPALPSLSRDALAGDASALPGLALGPAGGAAGLGAALPGTRPTRDDDDDAPDTPARPIARPGPSYPRDAQRAGIEGAVVVRLHVDARGRVDDVVVVRATPPEVFDAVALRTARSYRFEPARKHGRAVPSTIEQRIVFRLRR